MTKIHWPHAKSLAFEAVQERLSCKHAFQGDCNGCSMGQISPLMPAEGRSTRGVRSRRSTWETARS